MVVGAVLLLAGAGFALVPILPAATQTIDTFDPWEFNVTAAFSFTGTIPLSITWTSPDNASVELATCGSIAADEQCVDGTYANETGTGGTFTLAAKVNGAVGVFLTAGTTASVTVKEAQPTIGDLLVVAGVALVVAGLVLRRRRATPAPFPQVAPTG